MCHAARQLKLDVHICRRGKEMARAAQEHRRAYAAGIAVLAAHARGRLRIQTP
jgi:hypothetical protein